MNKIYCGERRLDSDEYFMYANEYLNVYSKGVFKVRPGNYEVKINEIFNELNKKKNEISNSGEYRAYRVTWNENDSFLFIQNWSQVCDRGSKTEWISILDNIIGK